jgi:CNT family concentrative nucleoside transporter
MLLHGVKNLKEQRNWKPVIYGIVFQVLLVCILMYVPVFVGAIEGIAQGFMKLKDATIEGAKFVFGYTGGGDLPFDINPNGNTFVFAFQAAPTIILVGALSAILTYLKILPVISKVIGFVFKFVFNIKESIGMVSAAKIFVGQLEAPLLIKHKLQSLSKSDILIIMSLAFATTSAAVMPIYAGAIEGICPDAMKHMILSSVISVISVLIICSIIMPSTEDPVKIKITKEEDGKPYESFMGAMAKGLSDGAFVWWCIVGSLLGMIALIALINYIFALFPDLGGEPITLQRIIGIFMYPFAWLIGIQDSDLTVISQILGTKLVLNEVIAFFDLANASVSQDSVLKTIYAIHNFGNFSCIGITVGGMTALAPGQKCITEIAWKAFLAGLLATGLTSTLMSVFLSF